MICFKNFTSISWKIVFSLFDIPSVDFFIWAIILFKIKDLFHMTQKSPRNDRIESTSFMTGTKRDSI
jgi:hypothetical protein